MQDSHARIEAILNEYTLPVIGKPLSEVCRYDINSEEGLISIVLKSGFYANSLKEDVGKTLEQLVRDVNPGTRVAVTWHQQVFAHRTVGQAKPMPQVRNLIAISSGKGGVGKSTTSMNLALALKAEGAKVGLLDADIFGPSQSIMAGTAPDTRPEVKDQKFFMPINAHGLQLMSMGYLVTEETPVVWRGPKASGAFQQLLNQTYWQDLDYLIVDMPPGTGDIQLTLSQSAPVTASVIVTTPQDIALLDAIKGIEMYRKVGIPILGIIENMSLHTCSHCGHTEAIFGEGGGQRIAETYQTSLLGALPLDLRIRRHADKGLPTVVAEPDSDIARFYREIAIRTACELAQLPRASIIPNMSLVE